MPQNPLQILKDGASCWSASKPSHDDIRPTRRPGTPRPGKGRGPRPLFSLPVRPPRAFLTRKMDEAIERLESAKNVETRKSDSREVIQGRNGGLTSSDIPSPPTISLPSKNSTSIDDVDMTDHHELLVLVDEAESPTPRAKEVSHHNSEAVLRVPQPIVVDQIINNAIEQQKIHNAIEQLDDVYDWEEPRILKHKYKQVPLRSQSLDGDGRTDSLACSPRKSPNGISIPCDLTFGILGPPAYKPQIQPAEALAPIGLPNKGKEKLRTEKEPSADLISTDPTYSHPLPTTKSSATRIATQTACNEHPPCLQPANRAHPSSTSNRPTQSPPRSRCQPQLAQSEDCTSRMCPVLGTHSLGLYLHNNASRTRPEIYFGDSNPPPIVWFAVDLMSRGKANDMDEKMIEEFIKLHYFVSKKSAD